MKVSVITVTYNSAATLSRAIDSVKQQTYDDIEHIIVDGGSTDGTIDIISSAELSSNGHIRWISEKDNGIYDAMNKAIQMATGDIIGILNSDDYLTSSQVIAKIVENFDNQTDAVYGDVHFVKSDNIEKCVRYYSGKPFRP